MKLPILFLVTSVMFFGCKKAEVTTAADIQETAQQIGDVMASVDESGGSTGSIASMKDSERMQNSVRQSFQRFAPGELSENMIAKLFLPDAQAAACGGTGFSSCSGSSIVRSYNGCTVGSATFSGDVTLTWSNGNTACSMGTTPGARITRIPNFTVTGRRSASLTVSKTGTIGQRIELVTAAGLNSAVKFSDDGITRVFSIGSTVLFNQTSATSGDITVTGTSRSNRVMSGGSLNVTNNLTSVVCNYVPTNVTWSGGTCNCPTMGSWSGSCSNGKTTTLEITGCGTANYTEGTDIEAVTFDRCGT